jgi:hypothetical protein
MQPADLQVKETHRPQSLGQRKESQKFSSKGIPNKAAALGWTRLVASAP